VKIAARTKNPLSSQDEPTQKSPLSWVALNWVETGDMSGVLAIHPH